MGTRVEFLAVDIPPFEQFLDRSLADALRFAARRGSPRSFLWFHTDAGRYLASAEYGILFSDQQGRGKGYVHPTEAELDADPSLAVSCRRHLALGDTAELGGLIRVLADSDFTPWVHELSKGSYWWWICSLLSGLNRSNTLDSSERKQYETLFKRVLQSVGCGSSLPGPTAGLKPPGFPVIPQNQHEHWGMGIWTVEDVALFLRCTEHLLEREIEFGQPTDWEDRRIADWNEWVPAMLRQLLVIGQLGYVRPNMVSFIG